MKCKLKFSSIKFKNNNSKQWDLDLCTFINNSLNNEFNNNAIIVSISILKIRKWDIIEFKNFPA